MWTQSSPLFSLRIQNLLIRHLDSQTEWDRNLIITKIRNKHTALKTTSNNKSLLLHHDVITTIELYRPIPRHPPPLFHWNILILNVMEIWAVKLLFLGHVQLYTTLPVMSLIKLVGITRYKTRLGRYIMGTKLRIREAEDNDGKMKWRGQCYLCDTADDLYTLNLGQVGDWVVDL